MSFRLPTSCPRGSRPSGLWFATSSPTALFRWQQPWPFSVWCGRTTTCDGQRWKTPRTSERVACQRCFRFHPNAIKIDPILVRDLNIRICPFLQSHVHPRLDIAHTIKVFLSSYTSSAFLGRSGLSCVAVCRLPFNGAANYLLISMNQVKLILLE